MTNQFSAVRTFDLEIDEKPVCLHLERCFSESHLHDWACPMDNDEDMYDGVEHREPSDSSYGN